MADIAQRVAITNVVIMDQIQQLLELQAQKEKQRLKDAEARLAMENRKKAFDNLYPLYSHYIKYAKILMPNNQMLDTIGIVVKKNSS